MMPFAVYDSDGKILRTGICQDRMLARQARPGEYVIEGRASDVEHVVLDGKIYTKEEAAQLRAAAGRDPS